MILKSDNFYLFLIFASVVSSFVFCIGFFPYSINKEVDVVQPKAFHESRLDKNVLMIIDALRLDFIENESFNYLHQLLENKEACLLRLTVNLPTVTKPRIKVLETNQFLHLIIYLLRPYLSGTYIGHNT